MAITWDDVVGFAPELGTGVSADAQTDIVDFVNEELNADNLGGADSKRYRMALILYAAHLGSVVKTRGAAIGPVIAESLGKASRSYANTFTPSQSSLQATSYGRELAAIFSNSRGRIGRAV